MKEASHSQLHMTMLSGQVTFDRDYTCCLEDTSGSAIPSHRIVLHYAVFPGLQLTPQNRRIKIVCQQQKQN
jgi:hypothetical protein